MKDIDKILADIGFLAAANGLYNNAMQISDGLKAHAPDCVIPFFIDAFSALNRGDYKRALTQLLHIQAIDSKHFALDTYLNLTRQLIDSNNADFTSSSTSADSHRRIPLSPDNNVLARSSDVSLNKL